MRWSRRSSFTSYVRASSFLLDKGHCSDGLSESQWERRVLDLTVALELGVTWRRVFKVL